MQSLALHLGIKLLQKQHIFNRNDRLTPVFSYIPLFVVVAPCPRNIKRAVGKLCGFYIFALGAADSF